MDFQTLTQVLKNPSIYPDNPSEVHLIETHISYIYLTGKFVYKIKRPVNFGFLDFTTLEKRHFYCLQEVRLNRRLTEDVYLEVEEIREDDGRVSFRGNGKTIEYAVKMRQLPAEGMLHRMLDDGRATPELMERIAHKVALFHKEAETGPEISSYGDISVIRKNAHENFIQTVPYIGRTILREQYEFISSRSDDFIEHNRSIFAGRKREGRIRDCHGDLHIDSICIEGDSVLIFDCIEFNDRFRYSDIVADIAFLAMDMEFNNRYDLSDALIESYVRDSHDEDLPVVLRFYKAYRAYVRGKVTGFLVDSQDISEEERDKAVERAKRYYGLAYSYFMPPTLIVTAGLMGTGKSVISAHAGNAVGCGVLRSDVVRKELAGCSPEEHRYEKFGEGIYTRSFSEKTYAELHRRARGILGRGRSVIIDASYMERAEREKAAATARETGSRFFIIECVCDDAVVKERLERRMETKEISDGRWEIYGRQKAKFEPVSDNEGRVVKLDTSRPVEENIGLMLKLTGR